MLANISYKVSIFVDLTDLKAETGNVIELLQEFNDYEMMPAVADGSELGNVQKPKFTFAIDKNRKKITIFNDRIDFLSVSNAKEGFVTDEICKMIDQASDILGRILKKYQKTAYRLAVFKEYMLFELQRDESIRFAKEKFAYIPYYEQADIVECGSRVVARKNVVFTEEMQEDCNIITMINRVNFEDFEGINSVMKDAFKIDFDLNTFQGNLNARFGKDEIRSFCLQMDQVSDSLIKQIIGE